MAIAIVVIIFSVKPIISKLNMKYEMAMKLDVILCQIKVIFQNGRLFYIIHQTIT